MLFIWTCLRLFDKVSHSRLKHAHGWIWRQPHPMVRLLPHESPTTSCSCTWSNLILPPSQLLQVVLKAANDLADAVKFSQVAMFADDTKLFSTIKTKNDCEHLQNDLDNLRVWSSESGLSFNDKKCKAQHITRKFTPLTTTCKLSSNLEQIDCWSRITSPGTNNFMISWRKQISNWAISEGQRYTSITLRCDVSVFYIWLCCDLTWVMQRRYGLRSQFF